MKKSMRMVSVMMSAVMAMSAMSALAAGTYAEELPAEPETTITETTDTEDTDTETSNFDNFNFNFDPTIEHGTIPVTVDVSGIRGRVTGYDITLDYQYKANANSPEARGMRFLHPENVSAPDKDGNVLVKVHEVQTFTENTKDEESVEFNIPTSADLMTMQITLGYTSWVSGHNEICKYNYLDSHMSDSISSIKFDLDSTIKWYLFDYDVTGKIYIDGKLVCNKTV